METTRKSEQLHVSAETHVATAVMAHTYIDRSAEALSTDALLEMRGIHKRFTGVHALRGVDLEVRKGEIHALVGENGAGKSTLMLILAGVQKLDEGIINFAGHNDVAMLDERSAQTLGVAIVFQERSLFNLLTVAENIYAGRQPVDALGFINTRKMHAESRLLLERLGVDIDPRTPLARLSFAQQQMVEVAKALSLKAKLLILDEPTAALTDVETKALFKVIGQLRDQGVGIIYISHKLEEVFYIADRVTVLKDGAYQGTFSISETNPRALVAKMVGREMLYDAVPRVIDERRATVLEVRGLGGSTGFAQDRNRDLVSPQISFKVRAGEILALAGLEGSGRSELALTIFGARPRYQGDILVDGQAKNIRSPRHAIAAGIGYLPSDRKEAGLFLDMSIASNIAAAKLGEFGNWWFDDRKLQHVSEGFCEKLKIATPSVRRVVRILSGGNQQKVVLSKWLLLKPRVLIVDEPTRGVDVGAKGEVHTLLKEFAGQGAAVIIISSELPEVLAVANRIVVMRYGRITADLPRHKADEEVIMHYASLDV